MAIALAVSRWLELAEGEDALPRMHAWLDEVEDRAVRRDATARANAFRRVRAWLAGCS
jgi:glutathione S-transferase